MPLWTLLGLMRRQADGALASEGRRRWPRRRHRHAALSPGALHRRVPSVRRCLPDPGYYDAADRGAGDGKAGRLDVDYGRCVVCQLCTEACPTEAMTPSSDWAFGAARREDLVWRTQPAAPARAG